MMGNKEKSKQLLSRNVEEVIDAKHLRAALLSGKKLRVKFGIDPTGDKIHIGRAVALWKLKEFQDLGTRSCWLSAILPRRWGILPISWKSAHS
jgi:tyrosyl-tRNA synthetase